MTAYTYAPPYCPTLRDRAHKALGYVITAPLWVVLAIAIRVRGGLHP